MSNRKTSEQFAAFYIVLEPAGKATRSRPIKISTQEEWQALPGRASMVLYSLRNARLQRMVKGKPCFSVPLGSQHEVLIHSLKSLLGGKNVRDNMIMGSQTLTEFFAENSRTNVMS